MVFKPYWWTHPSTVFNAPFDLQTSSALPLEDHMKFYFYPLFPTFYKFKWTQVNYVGEENSIHSSITDHGLRFIDLFSTLKLITEMFQKQKVVFCRVWMKYLKPNVLSRKGEALNVWFAFDKSFCCHIYLYLFLSSLSFRQKNCLISRKALSEK